MATAQEIQQWANGIGLPVCVGEEFACEHNGRLPQTLDELNNWGNSTGRRESNGNWHCIGCTPPSGGNNNGNGDGTYTPPPPPAASNSMMNWITENPMMIAVIGLGALMLLGGRRR